MVSPRFMVMVAWMMMANGAVGKHDVSSLSKNMRHEHGYKGSISQPHRSSQSMSHTSNHDHSAGAKHGHARMRSAGPNKTTEVYP